MNKKGMSGIIAAVLIILLAIAAVVVVWTFVIPILGEAEGGTTTLSLTVMGFDIIEKSVVIDEDNNVSFLIERKTGGGGEAGVVVVLEDNLTKTFTSNKYVSAGFKELDRKKLIITKVEHGLEGKIAKILVYPAITKDGDNIVVSSSASDSYRGSGSSGGGSSGGGETGCEGDGDCNDGVGCTIDTCESGTCVHTTNDGNCPDDGLYCNGNEYCDAVSDCQSAGNPCPELCDEGSDSCVECLDAGDCDDGVVCTDDSCVGGNCNNAVNDANCGPGEVCHATLDCGFVLSDCAVLSVQGRTYLLDSDIPNHVGGNCFDITADDITFDGGGHLVEGSGSDYGFAASGRNNFILTNVNVTNFDTGVYFGVGTNYSSVLNNFLYDNINGGVNIAGTNFHNSLEGNLIEGNSIWLNGFGIGISSSYHNTVNNNNISLNIAEGVILNAVSHYNNLTGNIINSNGDDGISIESGSAFGVVYGNTINSNSQDGIYFHSSSYQNISENNIHSNLGNGISFYMNSNYINLTNNIICGHGTDLYCSNSNTGSSSAGNFFDNIDGCTWLAGNDPCP